MKQKTRKLIALSRAVFSIAVLLLFPIYIAGPGLVIIQYWLTRLVDKTLEKDDITGFYAINTMPAKLEHRKGLVLFNFVNLNTIALTYGNEVEETVRRVLAQAIHHIIPPGSKVYDYNTDTKAILLSQVGGKQNLQRCMDSLSYNAIPIITKDGTEVQVHPIVEMCLYTNTTFDDNMAHAISYCRFALETSEFRAESRFLVFNAGRFQASRALNDKKDALIQVIRDTRINVRYQPIIETVTNTIIGYEAFSYIVDPIIECISEALDIAEQFNISIQLEKALSYAVLSDFRRRTKKITNKPKLFINVSAQAISAGAYKHDMWKMLGKEGQGEGFCLEILERGKVSADIIPEIRHQLRAKVTVALDDFGTGYNNHLALLLSKPDIIKVARELITDIHLDPQKQRVYSSVYNLAKAEGVLVLAEGVETKEEYEEVLRIGADYVQGYYIQKPNATILAKDTYWNV